MKEKKLEDSFYMLGPKSNANVYDHLKECDLYVTTSYTEAYPTVLYEAMVCKLPWVGPNVSGVKDIYNESPENSCILTEDSVEGIARGIKDAIHGKVNNKFKLEINKLNQKTLKNFYKLIGE